MAIWFMSNSNTDHFTGSQVGAGNIERSQTVRPVQGSKLGRSFAAIALLAGLTIAPLQSANATAAFARATGATCDKCHTANFPRLNPKGEKFLRNGFQLRQEAPVEFALGDDTEKETDKKDGGLKKLTDLFAIGGKLEALHATSSNGSPAIGAPLEIDLFATGTLAKDTSMYTAVAAENDAAMVHRFILGKTNLGGSTFANVRVGTIDPTTWTSFYGFGSTLDTANPAIGAYGSSHSSGGGFTTVGASYRENQAIEYYGYNDLILISAGLANGSAPATAEGAAPSPNFDKLDYWATGRIEIGKESSLSMLWYNANGYINNQTFTFASNIRSGNLDLRLQYSLDNTGGNTAAASGAGVVPAGVITARHTGSHGGTESASGADYRSGFTAQADYRLNDNLGGLVRYDTTDNGATSDSMETQLTLGVLYKPQPNIKVTAAYVSELQAAASTADVFGDHATVQVRFVF